jgi:NCS1 family nucleobase:cation symporter-1
VLVPMLLIGHAGTKYGIPYAVLARASFGTTGARLPALMRAIVACGWYGIQTWFGGQMIYTLAGALLGHELGGEKIAWLGINGAQFACFLVFWAIQFWYIVHGIDAIRKLETYTAPLKIAICFVLLAWVYNKAGGFGPILDQPSQFVPGGTKAGQFWTTFWPSLTAMVGFWATLALNIPDFTRFAKTQRDQVLGQSIGLPVPMALLATLAVIVTSATVVLYGKALWDPVDLASRMTGVAVLVALVVLLIDTVSVNLAANLVGPAYDFSSLNPKAISYRTGGYITAFIAIAMMPWKILESTQGYIFTWLIGYSALLGPIAGIMIVDYYFVRRTELDVQQLYRHDGAYSVRERLEHGGHRGVRRRRAAEPAGLPERGVPRFVPERRRRLQDFVHLCLVRRHPGRRRGLRRDDAGPQAGNTRGRARLINFQGTLMSILIRGGTVVNADRAFRADVLCRGRQDRRRRRAPRRAPPGAQVDRRRRPVRDAGRDRSAHAHAAAVHGHGHRRRLLHRHGRGPGRRHHHHHGFRDPRPEAVAHGRHHTWRGWAEKSAADYTFHVASPGGTKACTPTWARWCASTA